MPITINGTGPVDGITSINTSVSSTELGYLDGVTSGIQSQINTSGGLVKIVDNTFSAQTTISFNNCFTSTYENYRLLISGTFSTSSLDMWLRFRSGGVDNSTSNYVTVTGLITGASTYVAQYAASSSRIQTYTTNSFTDGFLVDWTIGRPQLNTKTEVTGFTSRGGMEWQGGSYVAAASFDGFSLIFGSGFTGTVRLYGYRN